MILHFRAWDKATFADGPVAAYGYFDYDKNNPNEAAYVFYPTMWVRIEDVTFIDRRNDLVVEITYEPGSRMTELRLERYDVDIEGELFSFDGKTTDEQKEEEVERLANKIRSICGGAQYIAPTP